MRVAEAGDRRGGGGLLGEVGQGGVEACASDDAGGSDAVGRVLDSEVGVLPQQFASQSDGQVAGDLMGGVGQVKELSGGESEVSLIAAHAPDGCRDLGLLPPASSSVFGRAVIDEVPQVGRDLLEHLAAWPRTAAAG
jgi:hypothetical protein